MTQIEVAAAANLSTRQLSFIETGRGHPTRATLDRLADVLAIPPRELALILQNASSAFSTTDLLREPTFAKQVDRALALVVERHEPYPAFAMDQYGTIRIQNAASERFLAAILQPGYMVPGRELNLVRMLFDEDGVRPAIANWEDIARAALQRAEIDVLTSPDDPKTRGIRDHARAQAPSPREWERRGAVQPLDPIVDLVINARGTQIRVATVRTILRTPDGINVERTFIQSFYPVDAHARSFFERLARDAARPPALPAPRRLHSGGGRGRRRKGRAAGMR